MMSVQALFCMGLALAGVNMVADVAAVAAVAQDLDDDNRQQMHQQNHSHISADDLLQVGEDTENSPQLLDTNYNLNVYSPDKIDRRQTPPLGCNGDYSSSSGSLRYPLSGGSYGRNENCTWIIRAAGPIRITFQESYTVRGYNHLYIRDGDSRYGSSLLNCTGSGSTSGCSPGVTLTTTSNAAHLHFESSSYDTGYGFKILWETAEIQVLVNPSEGVRLECGFAGDYRFCLWEKEDHIILVQDVSKGLYPGLRRPDTEKLNQQCSIVIKRASERDHGIWTCRIYTKGDMLLANKMVVLTEAPSATVVSPQQITVNTGDRAFPKCVVRSARPAADIDWTINGRNISSHAIVKKTKTNDQGNYKTESNLSVDFSLAENGQMLKCVVRHPALAEPEILSVPITVLGFAPIQRHGEVNTLYNISIGIDYMIKFSFSVSPTLTALKWYYGPNFQERSKLIQIPSENRKFAASFFDLNNGNFQVHLKITQITEENMRTKFTLRLENGRINVDYRFMLSKDENPSECLEDFVMSYDAQHCYLLYRDVERNYTDAQKKCRDEGLMPVQLSDEDAADVRNMLLDKYGNGPVWLEARGNNNLIAWNRSKTEIQNGNPLWWPATPKDLDTRWCLLFLVDVTKWNSHPGSPYQPSLCDRKLWTFCEGDPPKPKKEPSTTKTLDLHCTGGWLFTSGGSNKCFMIFQDRRRSWEETKRKCEENGLLTAKPSSAHLAITLRKHLLEKYGDGRVWLGARADGTNYHWEQDNSEVGLSSPLWQKHKQRGPWDYCHSHVGPKCGRTTRNHCLTLQVGRSEWRDGPDRPFASYKCSTHQYALCEYKGCPTGFFSLDDTPQCYKLLHEFWSNWTEASSRCRDQGLGLAQPPHESAFALRKYILDTYGDLRWGVWVGARRANPASAVLWEKQGHDPSPASAAGSRAVSAVASDGPPGSGIPRGSPLWVPGFGPDGQVPRDYDLHCVIMLVNEQLLSSDPSTVYGLNGCGEDRYSPLCQAFDPEKE